jgi:AAA+ superfamily predicted ATPase
LSGHLEWANTTAVDLEVDRITDVTWNKQAFESLVVDEDTKELIHALITNQLAAEKGTDLISGKGNGLIVLLHGGPGTGKTFTAESVAEIAEKPLYRVTCGDIGTKPEDVEQYLESVLHLGKIWGCVVLLDEADVFLEERSLKDLQRNALVSAFLRVLEYYDGILILTSNRVGTFDAAFKSRIQLALHYQNLDFPSRRKIWRNFMNRLKNMEEPNIDFEDIADHIDDLAKEDMNGRQIRNAITTARQLAQYKGKDFCYAHLKHVISVAGKFDKYLRTVKEGFSDDEIARGEQLR